jgi:hypothetical protein
MRLERLGELKIIHLIGTRTHNLPACSIVPQTTTLPRTMENVQKVNNCNNIPLPHTFRSDQYFKIVILSRVLVTKDGVSDW